MVLGRDRLEKNAGRLLTKKGGEIIRRLVVHDELGDGERVG